MIRRFVLLLALVLLPLNVSSCTIKGPSNGVFAVDGKEVQKRWWANERLLQRIVEGRRFDPRRYEATVEFFEETTGIPASDHQTFVGRLPSHTLAEDLKKWRDWYEQHKGSLYWDPASSRIRVRGAEDESPSEGPRDGAG